jgi:hypothetical protein
MVSVGFCCCSWGCTGFFEACFTKRTTPTTTTTSPTITAITTPLSAVGDGWILPSKDWHEHSGATTKVKKVNTRRYVILFLIMRSSFLVANFAAKEITR